MMWRAMLAVAKVVLAFLAIVVGTLIFLVLATRNAEAAHTEPAHPELCVVGLDFNQNGLVDWRDYARLLLLMTTAWGQDVSDCPVVLPIRTACSLPNAAGRYTCYTAPRDDGLWFYYGVPLAPL